MTWQRYICKPYMTQLNMALHNDIQQLLVNCVAGRRPIANVRPFVLCYPTYSTKMHENMVAGVAYQMNTLAAHISQMPHLQQMWVKHGHTMHPTPADPYLLTRIWLRQRGHGLNWLIASQIIDYNDLRQIHTNTWYPFRDQDTQGLNQPCLQ